MAKIGKNLAGVQITDEIVNRASSASARLVHDTILDDGSFRIRTASGGGGTLLALTTDYVLGSEDTGLTAEAGSTVFTTVSIVNSTYQNVNLYATYKTVGDYNDAEDINNLDTRATALESGTMTISGTKTFSSNIIGNLTGNASTVTNGVYTSGNQTIAGVKTFSSNPISSATQSTATNSLTRRDFVLWLDGANVKLTGNQTIAGVKTFSSAVTLTTAGTTTAQAVRADRSIATGSGLSGGGNLTANRTLTVDSTVVRTTGAQSIAGVKTFTSTIVGSVNGNAGTVTNGVYTTGNQSIAGDKTITGRTSFRNTGATLLVQKGDPTTDGLVLTSGNIGSSTRRITVTTPGTAIGASRTYTLPDAGADANFVMSQGTQTLSGNMTLLQMVAENDLGEYRMRQDAKSPSALFPQINLTSFSGVSTVNTTNWPLYTPYLRAIKLNIGATSTFLGVASGNTITLNYAVDNNALLAALAESVAHFGYNYTVDWGGTTYAISNISTLTRVITTVGNVSGVSTATFYPHRIAGSTTTARVFSLQGLGLIGREDADWYFVGGLARRGYMQGIEGKLRASRSDAAGIAGQTGAFFNESISGIGSGSEGAITVGFDTGLSNSATYGQARAAKTTHGPSWSVHIYQHGGRYIA